jgi:hypothetical protein
MKVVLQHEIELDHKHGLIDLWSVVRTFTPEKGDAEVTDLGECTRPMLVLFQNSKTVTYEIKPSRSVVRFVTNYVNGIATQ